MKRKTKKSKVIEMLPEYDFRGGQRGRYAKRSVSRTNLIVVSPGTKGHTSKRKLKKAA
jgi:hypothetical protein